MAIKLQAWKIYLLLCTVWLAGCTNIQSLQDLEVKFIGIEPASTQGLNPNFKLNLLITNPNEQDLQIQGIAFNLALADQKVLSGVSNQIPTLKAYTETPVSINASISIIELFKIIPHLSQNAGEEISYRLNTKIDPKGFIAFNIKNEGVLDEKFLQGLINSN
ncbi:MAG: LEA type 2 family protein [Psychromonas sp.]